MWLRKIIINWLFKYPIPKYLHSIVFYENIKWIKRNKTSGEYTYIRKIYLAENNLLNNKTSWFLRDFNDESST